ncbi:MAG: hypothetical protein ACRC80_14925 [Waterburya sp.]
MPIIYDLIMGIVAGTFTELTDGIINTDDGAWDESIFPSEYEEFFASFFVPNVSVIIEDQYQAWICLLEQFWHC